MPVTIKKGSVLLYITILLVNLWSKQFDEQPKGISISIRAIWLEQHFIAKSGGIK
jgi:hypothetical protein